MVIVAVTTEMPSDSNRPGADRPLLELRAKRTRNATRGTTR
jgi:hypothetical protein